MRALKPKDRNAISMINNSLTIIFIFAGLILMIMAIGKTKNLLSLLKNDKYLSRWKTLYSLMTLFIVGYLASIALVSSGHQDMLFPVVGLIFFFGALFVYLVVKTGSETIEELFNTSVSKTYVDNIIKSMADSLIVANLGADRTIRTINKATLNLLGYEEHELLGKPVDFILDKKYISKLSIEDVVKRGFIKDIEMKYIRKDGKKIPVLFSASAMKSINGVTEGIICVAQDITIRKLAEEKLKQSADTLAAANDMKELLLDIITHDLKNPIGVIEGVSSMILEENPGDPMINVIKESCDNLCKVFENAQALAKTVTDEAIEKQEIDLSSMLKNLTSEFLPAFTEEGMELTTIVPESLRVRAHPIIEQVIRNYLSNALKYARSGKQVIMEAGNSQGVVEISVSDFGNTIPVEQRERIFQRTTQLEKGRGRGLGLAIVKRIADAHDGKVGVYPNEPRGNVFYLKLPV